MDIERKLSQFRISVFFLKCYQGDIKKQLAGFHKNAIGYVQSGHTLFCIFSKTPPHYLVSENLMLRPKSCVVVG